MSSFSRLSAWSTLAMLVVLCGAAIADDYPTTAGALTTPVYRCGEGRYSQAPCTGGVRLDVPRTVRVPEREVPVVQARVRAADHTKPQAETVVRCVTPGC